MWFLVILALAKNIIPLIRQKSFLEKTKKGGMARDVTNRGGVRGASPPAFTRTTITSKSPSEAVFIHDNQHFRNFDDNSLGKLSSVIFVTMMTVDDFTTMKDNFNLSSSMTTTTRIPINDDGTNWAH